MTNKRGLGRGLSALFGEAKKVDVNSENSSNQKYLPISDLNRNKFQPRTNFDESKLEELANSIKQSGVIQPIAVRDDIADPGKFEIIAGERRWLAAQKAGLHKVPVVILNLSDSQTLEVAIVENIQRENLNVVEEAKAYSRLTKEFGYDQDRIANMMSKSRSHISNTLRLLTLPKDVINMIEEGMISAGQARPLIGLPDASSVAEEILKKRMSARTVESLVKQNKLNKKPPSEKDSNILNEQSEIQQKLGLNVTISNKKNNSGKIVIEYKNLDQFETISNILKRS